MSRDSLFGLVPKPWAGQQMSRVRLPEKHDFFLLYTVSKPAPPRRTQPFVFVVKGPAAEATDAPQP